MDEMQDERRGARPRQLGIGSTNQIGDNSGEMSAVADVRLPGDGKVDAISAGGLHTCVILRANRKALCWGYGVYGQLGRDSTSAVGGSGGVDELVGLAPINVGGTSGEIQNIVCGYYHTCAQVKGMGLWCWGYNNNGQLGIGSTTNQGTSSGSMASLSGVEALPGGASCDIVRVSVRV